MHLKLYKCHWFSGNECTFLATDSSSYRTYISIDLFHGSIVAPIPGGNAFLYLQIIPQFCNPVFKALNQKKLHEQSIY